MLKSIGGRDLGQKQPLRGGWEGAPVEKGQFQSFLKSVGSDIEGQRVFSNFDELCLSQQVNVFQNVLFHQGVDFPFLKTRAFVVIFGKGTDLHLRHFVVDVFD